MKSLKATERQQLRSDAVRYLGIAIVGLVVDFAIALALRYAFDIPLPVATGAGFLITVAINYALLERFLFNRRALSWSRLAKTYAAAQGALLIRILAAWGLSYGLNGSVEADAVVLLLSACVSFIANFIIVRALLR